MKRILTLFLVVLMLLTMTACGQPSQTESTQPNTTADQNTDITGQETPTTPKETSASEETTTPATTTPKETPKPAVPQGDFSFPFAGVTLVPGKAFDPTALPEAESVFQAPSCAIEGTDTMYSYGTIEVTAVNDGTGEVIYSIYITDANTPTAEGLYIGDTLEHVVAAYGEDYREEGGQITYQRGDTLLVIVMDGEYVASIDFRWAV